MQARSTHVELYMQMPYYRQHLACQFACLQRFSQNPRYRYSQFSCLQIFPPIIVTACQFVCLQRFPRNPRYRIQVSLHVNRDFPEILVTACQFACEQRFSRNPR